MTAPKGKKIKQRAERARIKLWLVRISRASFAGWRFWQLAKLELLNKVL